jgi:hypothetical protein
MRRPSLHQPTSDLGQLELHHPGDKQHTESPAPPMNPGVSASAAAAPAMDEAELSGRRWIGSLVAPASVE